MSSSLDQTLELSELYRIDERIHRFQTVFGRLSTILLVVGGVAVIGLILSFILSWFGITSAVTTPLLVASTPIFILAVIATGILPVIMRRRLERIYLDAGLAPLRPRIIKEAEALNLIEVPEPPRNSGNA